MEEQCEKGKMVKKKRKRATMVKSFLKKKEKRIFSRRKKVFKKRLKKGTRKRVKKQDIQNKEMERGLLGKKFSLLFREFHVQRLQSRQEEPTEEEEMKQQQRMMIMKDLIRKIRSKGRMDAENQWWVLELFFFTRKSSEHVSTKKYRETQSHCHRQTGEPHSTKPASRFSEILRNCDLETLETT